MVHGQTNFTALGLQQEGHEPESLFASVLNGSDTVDPASIAASATATTEITVTGAKVGDFVMVAPGVDLQGMVCTGYVSAADTVTVILFNPTSAPVDLDSSNWKVKVFS